MFEDIPFEDLESRGFLVIRGFLSSDEMAFFKEDYFSKQSGDNANYAVVEADGNACKKIEGKLSQALSNVQRQTKIGADIAAPHVGYYFASEEVSFGWHQDHESYYALQNHYEYLNFFMPIYKPDKDKGNLKVVPWDNLKECSESAHNSLIRSGASITHTIGSKTVVTEVNGAIAEFPADIEDICEVPPLEAGDLLLIRGDIIHRTQDTDTDRIALSLRYTNPDMKVSRRELLTGGKRKTNMMLNNWKDFGPMLDVFKRNGESMSWQQLQSEVEKIDRADFAPPSGLKRRLVILGLWFQRLMTNTLRSSLQCERAYQKNLSYVERLKQS